MGSGFGGVPGGGIPGGGIPQVRGFPGDFPSPRQPSGPVGLLGVPDQGQLVLPALTVHAAPRRIPSQVSGETKKPQVTVPAKAWVSILNRTKTRTERSTTY